MNEPVQAWTRPPPPLCGNQRGTFTEYSIVERLPEILRRTIAENQFSAEVRRRLEAFGASIPHGPIEPIDDRGAPDFSDWQNYAAPHLGRSFLDVPWFFVENYFYRRILAIVGHFSEPQASQRFDPFAGQKRLGLSTSSGAIAELTEGVEERLGPSLGPERFSMLLRYLLASMLWGNSADLSLWPAEAGGQTAALAGQLLADDLQDAIEKLAGGVTSVCLLLDNAGYELVTDLVFADVLLRSQRCDRVCLEVKAHPTFVSDATELDLAWTLAQLEASDHLTTLNFGRRLRRYALAGSLSLHADFFYNSPLACWDMPRSLRERLVGFDLIVSKGDANYRRWLGDRHWPYSADLQEILGYAPAPLLLSRTCKSEVLAGVTAPALSAAAEIDSDFIINGRWGVLQFARGSTMKAS